MIRVLGIDPGINGALAFLTDGALVVHDMPTLALQRNGKAKRELDGYGVARLIDDAFPVTAAAIEIANGRPGQDSGADCSFCKLAGRLIGIVEANFIRHEPVAPVRWRRTVGIKAGAGKDASRARAAALFPEQSALFARVKDDGRAEAALIAWWLAQQLGQELRAA